MTLGGNDTIDISKGVTQNSFIDAGAGDDNVKGGKGEDLIFGGDGDDTIDARNGNDIIFGGDGDDSLKGHKGDDIIHGGAGNDKFNEKKSGNDILIGGLDSDELKGKDDEDIVIAGDVYFGSDPITALTAIRDEWTSNRSFQERIDNISGIGSGDRLNGDFFLTYNTRVIADNSVDELFINDGDDWWFEDLEDLLEDE